MTILGELEKKKRRRPPDRVEVNAARRVRREAKRERADQ
jgi:hypothetical protein